MDMLQTHFKEFTVLRCRLEPYPSLTISVRQTYWQSAMSRATGSVGEGWATFRELWGSLHPLSQARRLETMAILQPLAEIQVRMKSDQELRSEGH